MLKAPHLHTTLILLLKVILDNTIHNHRYRPLSQALVITNFTIQKKFRPGVQVSTGGKVSRISKNFYSIHQIINSISHRSLGRPAAHEAHLEHKYEADYIAH